MNLKQLRYFLAVAEEKQITAAAQRLFIAQPPLSYQLKQLEKELGVQLFERTAHGVNLTDAGKELQTYAERILSLADEAKTQVNRTAKGELGTIKIGSISSSVGQLPNEAFIRLRKYYPNISFEIHEENTFGIMEELNSNLIDLGIVRTPFNHQGVETKTITDEKMMAVTTNINLLKKKVVTLNDLDQEALIIYRRFENIFNESFAHQGIQPYYAVKCDDARTAILWALKGMGTALVPQSIAQLYGQQYYVPVNHASWETHLQLVWHKEKYSPLIRRIIALF